MSFATMKIAETVVFFAAGLIFLAWQWWDVRRARRITTPMSAFSRPPSAGAGHPEGQKQADPGAGEPVQVKALVD